MALFGLELDSALFAKKGIFALEADSAFYSTLVNDDMISLGRQCNAMVK